MAGQNFGRYFRFWMLVAVIVCWAAGPGLVSARHFDGSAVRPPGPPPAIQIDDSVEPVSVNATVMLIDPAGGYVIIAEKTFERVEYELDGQKFCLSLDKLTKLKKGMRVIATGFRLTDGRIIAESIEAVLSEK